ncbi:hypothetical protein AQUCO_06400013v1 [Aquilegia coerulea]|uniref:Uncharacterized protein n=1 Tax=Aquilegia coerulea TaxID=218851 RepID=A0A2G5CCG0_AQUCA|nr:hypothetical protein AQUCO_06400013v1 [Aquilegia coerulea]
MKLIMTALVLVRRRVKGSLFRLIMFMRQAPVTNKRFEMKFIHVQILRSLINYHWYGENHDNRLYDIKSGLLSWMLKDESRI